MEDDAVVEMFAGLSAENDATNKTCFSQGSLAASAAVLTLCTNRRREECG